MRIRRHLLLIAALALLGGCVDTSGLMVGGGDNPPPADGSTEDVGLDGTMTDGDPPGDSGTDVLPPTDGSPQDSNPPMDTDPPMDGAPMDTMDTMPPDPPECSRPMVLVAQVSNTASDRKLRRFSVSGGVWTECDALTLGGNMPNADLVAFLDGNYVVMSSEGDGAGQGVHFIRPNDTLLNSIQSAHRSNTGYDKAIVNVDGVETVAFGSIYRITSTRTSFADISCIEFFTRNGSVRGINTAGGGNLCTGSLDSIDGWGGTSGFGTNVADADTILGVQYGQPLIALNPTTDTLVDLITPDPGADDNITVNSERVGSQVVYAFLQRTGGEYVVKTRIGLAGDQYTHTCGDCDIQNYLLDPEEAGSVYLECGPQEIRRARIDGTCGSVASAPAGSRIADLFTVR